MNYVSNIVLWLVPSKVNQYNPKILRGNTLLYVAVLFLALKIASIALYIPFPNNLFFADITRVDLTQLLNESRKSLGLNKLTESTILDQAAKLKAQDMINNNYFAHKSPAGVAPWHWFSQAGYTYKYAGENLAVGFINSPEVFDAWINSPGHKANIVNSNYKEVGTAVMHGFQGNSIVVVQLFGSLATAKPPIQKVVAKPSTAKIIAEVIPPTPPITPTPTTIENSSIVAPVEKPIVSASNPISKVLSGSDIIIEKSGNNTINSAYAKWINIIVYSNGDIFQYLAYALLLVISGFLIITIAVYAEKTHSNLVLKSLVIIAIIGVSLVINNDFIVNIIPHQVII